MARVVEVEGVAEAQRALDRVVDELGDLDRTVGVDIASTILVAAQWGAPRRTGLLAASGHLDQGDGRVAAVFGADHAPPVHQGVPSRNMAGQPFLNAAAARVEGTINRQATTAVERIARRAD